MTSNRHLGPEQDKNFADLVWIHNSSDAITLGDRCYTCGVEQDYEAIQGTYSLHTRDCDYAPEATWVSGSMQQNLDDQRLTERHREFARYRIVEKQREERDLQYELDRQADQPANIEESANSKALKQFGVTFAKLMTNFDADQAKLEITNYQTWVSVNERPEETDTPWIEFLNDYIEKLREMILEEKMTEELD
jgi:hypothetical protein